MATSPLPNPSESLHADVLRLLDRLPHTRHGELIQLALATIVRMAEDDIDRLDWKICNASLQDMERAFKTFYPYQHVRKIAIFGSARIGEDSPEYQMTVDFARAITEQGFMVITGAGVASCRPEMRARAGRNPLASISNYPLSRSKSFY